MHILIDSKSCISLQTAEVAQPWLSVSLEKCWWLCQDQQVAIEDQVHPTSRQISEVGESQIGKAPRAQTPECLLVLLYLHVFAAAILLWYLPWCDWMCRDPHCL